jgi:hypothetical protein
MLFPDIPIIDFSDCADTIDSAGTCWTGLAPALRLTNHLELGFRGKNADLVHRQNNEEEGFVIPDSDRLLFAAASPIKLTY